MSKTIKLLELFSGIQSQERALRQLKIPYESVGVCDCDKDVLVSSAAMRFDLEKEIANYDFPSVEIMIEELQQKNIGYDFVHQKHTITSRTPIVKLKQYYISDKLLKNLGDISKVERLPRANFVTYSSPCQSFSVAGKLAGAAKTCTKCGHKWDIDFSNPDYNYKCPICGSASLESTTSGLLQEVQRLLSVAYEENELPEYLLLENVKNLVGKKFIDQFTAWVRWLDSIGYNTYWKILNGKHYGIPQNRERVFAISIRKDVDTKGFIFPETIPLTTRLKDVLEKNVDEKYYLPDERIEKILNTAFMQEKMKAQLKTEPASEEELTPVRLGGLYDSEEGRHQAGAIWDKDAISPTLDTMQGGNRQPYIVDEIKVVGNYMPSGHDASRVVDIDGVEPQIIKAGQLEGSFDQSGRVYDPEGIAPTIMSNSHGKTSGGYTSPKVIIEEVEPFIVASRGRNPDNPSDRTVGAPTEQRLEPNFSGCTNTLTSVQKDNYVCEPQVVIGSMQVNAYVGDGEISPSLTAAMGMGGGQIPMVGYVEPQVKKSIWTETQKQMITEDGNVKRYINSDIVDKFEVGDCADISFPNGYNKANRVFDGYAPVINGTTTQSSFIVKEPIIYDDYNSHISSDQDVINTLTCNCGAAAERNGVKIIEAEIMTEDVVFPVMVRKYTVDCNLLCECLRDHKENSNFSNKEIAEMLDVPMTKVEHWFRRDDSFAIPDSDVWFKLKELLGITTNEFDESIMTFEIKDGVYDKANRCYYVDGIAPTLTAASANEKIIEPVIIEDFYQSREPRIYSETAPTIRSERTGLKTADGEFEDVVERIKWRIRKLTPCECLRLMNFTDSDYQAMAKYVSSSAIYKQAGNSIIVANLIALMSSLFIEDGHKAEVWTKYALHFND